MSAILWAGLRQVQAARDALAWSLGGRVISQLDAAGVQSWLQEQDLGEDVATVGNPVGEIAKAMEMRRKALLGRDEWLSIEDKASRSSHPEIDDLGMDRSGAGWRHVANFCITSAFVRILGAMEQHEIDVLKVLFYFRPSGLLGPAVEQEELSPDPDEVLKVVRETPQSEGGKEVFKLPSIWTWLKKYAENNADRGSILKNVFGITSTPPEWPKKKTSAYNSERAELYKLRNKVAHGRERVDMTLAKYIEAEVHVYQAMCHLNQACKTEQRLLI